MPKLNILVPHNLSQDEALKRIKTLISEMKTRFADEISDLREQWNGNKGIFSFSVNGFDISGTLIVEKNNVEFSGNLPFAVIFIKKEIDCAIRERVKSLLAQPSSDL